MEMPIKEDTDFRFKPPMHLLPALPLMEVGSCMGYGAEKYGVNNYKKGDGLDPNRLLGAALRHIYLHLDGEMEDNESHLFHLAHAASNLLMAMDLILVKGAKHGVSSDSGESPLDINT